MTTTRRPSRRGAFIRCSMLSGWRARAETATFRASLDAALEKLDSFTLAEIGEAVRREQRRRAIRVSDKRREERNDG